MTDDLVGIDGAEINPQARAQWRKERQGELRRKQETQDPLIDAWNKAFDKPKSYRKKRNKQ